jgi:hypothetical protein
VDIRERKYPPLGTAPVDSNTRSEATEAVRKPVNIISEDYEAAPRETIQSVIERVGKQREPEILAAYERSRPREPGGAEEVGIESYEDDHPTHFDWREDVLGLVNRIQTQFPWQTYANTYFWHPPYDPPIITVQYDAVSVDFWGGGIEDGVYVGYRGKPIWTSIDGYEVWNALFHDPDWPNISWIIWDGWMWLRGSGWTGAPWGPPDSDAGHYNHIHVTYMW